MTDTAIEITGLFKRFGSIPALRGLDLRVPRGSVCGLVGRNGAGKTTTIRCMLDLLRPDAGTIRVLGLDAVRDSVAIRSRVGYVPESPDHYDWMTVEQIFRFNAGFFDTWDDELARGLRRELALPADRRLRDLSRGNRAKVGLAMAIAQRPDLLLLDDPTAGLDPVARREFLEATIAHAQEEGQTVLFSTHLVHEMERVADHVAIVDEGRTLLQEEIERLKQRARRIEITFTDGPVPTEVLSDLLQPAAVDAHPGGVSLLTYEFRPEIVPRLETLGTGVSVHDLELEEIFVCLTRAPSATEAHRSQTDA
jgi:ABC-2 type transport system ATP-binding protein